MRKFRSVAFASCLVIPVLLSSCSNQSSEVTALELQKQLQSSELPCFDFDTRSIPGGTGVDCSSTRGESSDYFFSVYPDTKGKEKALADKCTGQDGEQADILLATRLVDGSNWFAASLSGSLVSTIDIERVLGGSETNFYTMCENLGYLVGQDGEGIVQSPSDSEAIPGISESTGAWDPKSLDGISVTVGSKDFDEQLLLGEILVQAFGAAGAEVTNQVNLGGTSVARAALLSGEIDVYPEYNGTGYAVHLEQENPSFDAAELTGKVKEMDLKENNIAWIGRSPFNNTYGFASSPEATEANGGPFTTQTFMEYVRDNSDAVVCMETEFPDRPDGLILTETATGIELPEEQRNILDTGIIYTETADNNCTFGEVYTTDGRIPALGLTLVEDPGINILYNVSAAMRAETYDQAPDQFEAIVAAILAPLDNIKMAELNKRVSADGEEPSTVANNFLVEQGIITN